jgi:hypothetical protein
MDCYLLGTSLSYIEKISLAATKGLWFLLNEFCYYYGSDSSGLLLVVDWLSFCGGLLAIGINLGLD